MGYGVTLLNFRNGRMTTIPRDAIVSVLERHGCWVPQLREGSNEVGLPDNKTGRSPFGEFAVLSVVDGEITEFGLSRPQGTPQCRSLLFSLINEAALTMFPDYGGVIYARGDVFHDVPQNILDQFSERIVVSRPEDCAT